MQPKRYRPLPTVPSVVFAFLLPKIPIAFVLA